MAIAVKPSASPKEKHARTKRQQNGRLTTEIAQLFPRQGEWTEEAYLSLPETNHIIELSNGRLVMPDLPTDSHQLAVGEMFAAIHSFARQHKLGQTRVAPLRVHLWEGKFREPDVVFVSAERADRIGEDYWGVPDLVVEVISPRRERSSGTEKTDRKDKFQEYAQAGVSEYWLVDTVECTIEVYVLRDASYQRLGKWGIGEVARSEILPNFEVPVATIVEGTA